MFGGGGPIVNGGQGSERSFARSTSLAGQFEWLSHELFVAIVAYWYVFALQFPMI